MTDIVMTAWYIWKIEEKKSKPRQVNIEEIVRRVFLGPLGPQVMGLYVRH